MATKKKGTPSSFGVLAKLALVACGGGGILAADQFGIVDALLGGGAPQEVVAVAEAVMDIPMARTVLDTMRNGTYDGLSFALHGLVDVTLYPFKIAKEGF